MLSLLTKLFDKVVISITKKKISNAPSVTEEKKEKYKLEIVKKPIVRKEEPEAREEEGLISTDCQEQPIILQEVAEEACNELLEKKELFLPEGEYFKGPTRKKHIFLHHTAGWENPFKVINDWASDKRGQVATEYVLGGPRITDGDLTNDGKLVKAMPEGAWGYHLGIGGRAMHRESVGIELTNFGYLTKGGFYKQIEGKRTWVKKQPGKFYTYVGTLVDDAQVTDLGAKFRGYQYWHSYSDAQILMLKKWIKYIGERDNINVSKGLPKLISEVGAFDAFDFCSIDYVERNPGVWCHTNVQKGKFDLYPHPKLVDMLLSL